MLEHIQQGMHYSTAFLIDILHRVLSLSFYLFLGYIHLKLLLKFYTFKGYYYLYLNRIKNIFLILQFFCISLCFPIITGYKLLSIYISVILSVIISMASFLIIYWKNSKMYQKQLIYISLFVFSFQSFLSYSLQDICVCVFNKQYGFSLFDPDYQVSTRLIRQIFLKSEDVCPKSTIQHVYTSLGENSAHEVYIGAHGGTDLEQILLETCILEEKQNSQNQQELHCKNNTQQSYILNKKFVEGIESKGQRHLFQHYISDLQQNTLYNFKFYSYDKQVLLSQTNYKTLPLDTKSEDVKIVIGGDTGTTPSDIQLIEQIRKTDPQVVFIGGDVSYDDGIRSCYYSWDTYLNMWNEHLFLPLNRTVPFVFALGNHDVGYNAQNGIDPNTEEPLLFEYFRFSQKSQFYYHHIIANSIFFSLDTGYVVDPKDQVEFLDKISEKYPNHAKFSQYHVHIYPVCWDTTVIWNADKPAMDVMEKYWVPLFEKHKFMGCFENHGHQFKKTFPLTQGKIDEENGIVYFGDGSMGIDPPYICPEEYHMNKTLGIFENYDHYDSAHIWLITLQENQVVYDAISPNGNYKIQNYTRQIPILNKEINDEK